MTDIVASDRLTERAWIRLQAAYDEMNRVLFDSALPGCLMTWQRGKSFAGYFWPSKFRHRSGNGDAHEIALNPDCFVSDIDVMQTLVHEMTHLWQHVHGTPSRRAYHNREWATRMEEIGLMPSSTGAPGGKTTGERVLDYPIPGGPFEVAVRSFLEAGGPVVEWCSKPDRQSGEPGRSALAPAAGGTPSTDVERLADPKRKVKYHCPTCGSNAWGKPGLRLICGDDGAAFEIRN